MDINNLDIQHSPSSYTPKSVLQQHSLPVPFFNHGWGGVGGFATPPQPSPPLSAPPMTVASTLGNPQMPSNSSIFNTNSPMGYNIRLSGTTVQCKRKLEDETLDIRPTKQHISEERMAACLDSLHLSSHYTGHTLGSTNKSRKQPDSATSQDSPPKLYLSEELNRLAPVNSGALPESILKNFRRDGPCLEVVLWRPRSSIISPAPLPLPTTSSYQEEVNEKTVSSASSSPNPTPPESSSPATSSSSSLDNEDSMDLVSSSEDNNNTGGRVSAYTRSWIEENNNTGFRDLNPREDPNIEDEDDMEL